MTFIKTEQAGNGVSLFVVNAIRGNLNYLCKQKCIDVLESGEGGGGGGGDNQNNQKPQTACLVLIDTNSYGFVLYFDFGGLVV